MLCNNHFTREIFPKSNHSICTPQQCICRSDKVAEGVIKSSHRSTLASIASPYPYLQLPLRLLLSFYSATRWSPPQPLRCIHSISHHSLASTAPPMLLPFVLPPLSASVAQVALVPSFDRAASRFVGLREPSLVS